jgi:hypothetical protein
MICFAAYKVKESQPVELDDTTGTNSRKEGGTPGDDGAMQAQG